MKHNTLELLHLDAIRRATKDTLYKVQDSIEYPLCYSHAGVTEQIAIEFAEWVGLLGWNFNTSKKCWWNIAYADFFPTTKELFQEFLKTKQFALYKFL